jgi:hypothetical protein
MREIQVSKAVTLRVERKTWKGRDVVSLGKWINSKNYVGYGKGGLLIPVEKAKEVASAILEAIQG